LCPRLQLVIKSAENRHGSLCGNFASTAIQNTLEKGTEFLNQQYLWKWRLEDFRLVVIRVNANFIFQEELDPSLAPILNKSIVKQGN